MDTGISDLTHPCLKVRLKGQEALKAAPGDSVALHRKRLIRGRILLEYRRTID